MESPFGLLSVEEPPVAHGATVDLKRALWQPAGLTVAAAFKHMPWTCEMHTLNIAAW